jgi:hypothetical protein
VLAGNFGRELTSQNRWLPKLWGKKSARNFSTEQPNLGDFCQTETTKIRHVRSTSQSRKWGRRWAKNDEGRRDQFEHLKVRKQTTEGAEGTDKRTRQAAGATNRRPTHLGLLMKNMRSPTSKIQERSADKIGRDESKRRGTHLFLPYRFGYFTTRAIAFALSCRWKLITLRSTDRTCSGVRFSSSASQ